MGTTRKQLIGRVLALAVGVAAVTLPLASAPPTSAAPPRQTGTISDSVELTSLPSDPTLSLPKIDPTTVNIFGLTEVTITATLESSLTQTDGGSPPAAPEPAEEPAPEPEPAVTKQEAAPDGDDCDAFVESGTPPASADSELVSQSGVVDTFATTIIDPAQLAPYIGTGTVGFDWAPSSASNLSQPSEWTIAFLAAGAGEASVSYEYTPGENPPQPPPPELPELPEPPEAPEAPETLPNTGGPQGWLVALAGLLLMTGGGLLAFRLAGRDS